MMRLRLLYKRSTRLIAILLTAAAVVLLLWLRGPDWPRVGQAFTNVSWQWVAAALALNVVSVLLRVRCWWAILRRALEDPRLPYRGVLSSFAAGLIANAVLPGRGGELARVVVLHRRLEKRQGLWSTLIGSVIAYRLLDLIPAVAIAVWVVLAAPLPGWAFSSLISVIALGTLLFLVGIAIASRYDPRLDARLGPLRRAVAFARHGLAALRSPSSGARAAAYQTLGWLCQLLAVWTGMRAFNIDVPFSAAGLVLVLMNITLILPLWTGNVGLLQAAIALPLIGYGISYSRGFAFGIGLQAIEASVGVAYGLVFLTREGISFTALRQTRPSPAGESSNGKAGGKPPAHLET